jgi:predicted permease
MNEFLIKIIPIILLFATGWITRLLRVFTTRDADLFLKLVLNVTLPAMIIATAQDMIMDKSLIYLPFIAIMIVVILSIIGKFTGRQLKMNRPDTGSFLVGIMIMNTGFCLPFIEAIYGSQGVLIANLFDIGNTFMIYTFVYYHAIRYGKNESGSLDWKKFLKLPPLWGLLIGFGLRFLNVKIPAMPMLFFELAGVATTPLIMLSLGIYFHPRVKRLPKALLAVVLRMGFGFLISYLAQTVDKPTLENGKIKL